MDGARLSRFPHLSWLGFGLEATAGTRPLAFHLTTSCHSISVASVGRHAVRSISRGRETRWVTNERCVTCIPARDDQYDFVVDAVSPRYAILSFSIPRSHIVNYLQSEHSDASPDLGRFLALDDRVLADCMTRLATLTAGSDSSDDGRLDGAARRLVLRLAELSGAGVPDWHDDESTFDRRTLAAFVERIDTHLKVAPGLADLAPLVGLSPSHFAKKFRQSTGLSLHRFINRRRIGRSLEVLKSSSEPLAGVSLELGFSSQSHFTRLFSDLTGMTPAKYQKQFRRTVG